MSTVHVQPRPLQQTSCSTAIDVGNERGVPWNRRCPCVTTANSIWILAFLSLVCGCVIMTFGILDLWEASMDKLKVSIRLDPVIMKVENPDFDGGLTNYLPIWYAASITGIVLGLVQATTSSWFLINTFGDTEFLHYMAKIWMLSQVVVSFMLVTIMGGVYIGGFEPDLMILSFGIDFILIIIFMLISMPIIRRDGKPPGPEKIDLYGIGGQNSSIFTALLLL